MILQIKHTKDAARKLLKLINKFGKIAGHRINTQKYLSFLYTNNIRSETEIAITLKKKQLELKLPKEPKDPYADNYKILIKGKITQTNGDIDIPYSRIGRISIVQMTILLKPIYRFNVILVKLLMNLFTEFERKIL